MTRRNLFASVAALLAAALTPRGKTFAGSITAGPVKTVHVANGCIRNAKLGQLSVGPIKARNLRIFREQWHVRKVEGLT